MTRIEEPFEERLARLTADTENLKLRADFAARVMAQLDSPRQTVVNQDWTLHVVRWAKMGMAMATLAAAAFVVIAWDSTNAADQEEALAYGTVEAFE